MKKIYALIAAVVVLAAASVAVIVNAGKPESLFEANVEALSQEEDFMEECSEMCYYLYNGLCIYHSEAIGYNVICPDMSKKIYLD